MTVLTQQLPQLQQVQKVPPVTGQSFPTEHPQATAAAPAAAVLVPTVTGQSPQTDCPRGPSLVPPVTGQAARPDCPRAPPGAPVAPEYRQPGVPCLGEPARNPPSSTSRAPVFQEDQASSINKRAPPANNEAASSDSDGETGDATATGRPAQKLRKDRILQSEVSGRMTDFSLPQDTPAGPPPPPAKGKTGRVKTAADVVRVNIEPYWPHLHIQDRSIDYDQLTFPLFVKGFVQILKKH